MEGVRRISISVGKERVLKIRAPLSFKDLQRELLNLGVAFGSEIKTRDQNSKVSVSDDRTYFKWLEKCSFRGLSLSFKPAAAKTGKTAPESKKLTPLKTKNEVKVPAKRPRSRSSTPKKPENSKTPKKTPQKKLKKPSEALAKRSKSPRTPPKSPNPKQKPRAQSQSAPKPSQTNTPRSLRSSNSPKPSQTPSPTKPSPAPKSPTTASKPSQKLSNSNSLSSSPTKSTSGPLFSNLTVSPSPLNSLFSQTEAFSLAQDDVEVLKAFASIDDEGKLRVIDSQTGRSRIIRCFCIKKSSRLLLTADGILVTGGSGAPYQAMLIKSDYTVVPLVSMNFPRFWHCTGYIDGYPAVAAGAERSKVPKVFLNTVEVYKDGYWVNYPSTNINRASPCMSWDGRNVYIIGGVVTTGSVNTVVSDIEKFENGQWTILSITLRNPLISCGSIINQENELLVFGGEQSGGTLSSTLYSINLTDNTTKDLKPLLWFTKFTYGQQAQKISDHQIRCCDYQGRLLNIELPKTD